VDALKPYGIAGDFLGPTGSHWLNQNLKPVVNDESKLDTLFRMLKENPLPDDFLAERSYAPPRNPFADDDQAQENIQP